VTYSRGPLLLDEARLARAIRTLAAGCLLLGIAHIALLPPWEGFDELAHYSYIQQVADADPVPSSGSARISTDVERYRSGAPLPYASRPPFEDNGGLTYRSFFEGTRARDRGLVHRPPDEPRRYAPGPVANWEAQHPPLYYLVLAPVYRATRHLSWGAHLFSLRLVSYLFAWSAWALALYACLAARTPAPATERAFPWRWAAIGTALWPVLLPAWYPEFARLGNDSLAALAATAVWLVALRAVHTGLSTAHALAMGALLGAGALVKAPLVAVAVGLAGFWIVHAWTRRHATAFVPVATRVALMLVVVAAVAGWWYLRNRHPYLVALAPADEAALREGGGLMEGLARNFTLAQWLRAHAAVVATLGWSATWSLARPPHVFLAPLAMTVVLGAAGYAWALRRTRPGDLPWLPAWMAAPLLLALGYHALVRVALSGTAITPGYYFHVLCAPLGAALGLALRRGWTRAAGRRLVVALTAYALVFAIAVSWAQVLLFTGHLDKAGTAKHYRAVSALGVMFDVPAVLDRLGTLAFPALGATAFVFGGALVLLGLAGMAAAARTEMT
jgi:hypothetical protein